jgi:hypothetical protein
VKAVTRPARKTATALQTTVPAKRVQPKRKAGRPKLEVDMNLVERLCAWGSTHAEIADWLRVSPRTLAYWLADEKTTYPVKTPTLTKIAPAVIEELTLRAIMERGYAHMRISIRREQIALLKSGNATMAVWLGKQYLGQADRYRMVEPRDAGQPDKSNADTPAEVPVTLEELLTAYRKATK